jgi:hypothetical protein
MSINGGRIDFNNFMLDGTTVNEAQNTTPGAASGAFTGVDAIQEFQILTNNYAAEFGGAGGGIINVISKSGTNDFHGSLFEFHRNSVFDARNFFDPGEIPSFKRNQFGGSAGGPLMKNKFFIFGAYEGLRERLGVSRPFLVPTDEVRAGSLTLPSGAVLPVNAAVRPYIDLYPRTNVSGSAGGQGTYVRGATKSTDGDYLSIRGDYSIGDRDNFFARYTIDDSEVLDPNGVITDLFLETRNQYAGLEETHIFSPNIVNSLRFAYNRSFIEGDDLDVISVPSSLFWTPNATALGFFRGLEIAPLSSRSLVPRYLVVNSYEVSDHLTYNHGPNSAKFGGTFRRILFNAVSTNAPFGGYLYNSGGGFSAYQNFLRASPQFFAAPLTGSDAFRGIRSSLFAIYAQNDWRARRNLTVNFGIRYEIVTTPTEVHGRYANVRLTDTNSITGYPFFVPSDKKFAPRFGFAWDIFGDGKTSLRGGYGIFYVQEFPNLYRFAMSANPPYFTTGVAFIPPVPFPNAFPRLSAAPSLVGFSGYERNPPPSYVQQWNLGLQREIIGGITATVAYVGSRGIHLTSNGNRNTAVNFTILPNGEKQFPGPPGTRNPNRNPALGPTRIIYYNADSYYNGLQVNLERRLSRGLQFQMAYTWSKSIDTASDAVGNYAQSSHDLPQDPDNFAADRGPSVFDRRHVFNLYTIYQFPYKTKPDASGGRRVADFLLGGWQLNNIITYLSGTPFNPVLSRTNSNNGNPDNNERPDWVAGFNPDNAVTGRVEQWFNPAAFRAAPTGQFGNVSRNVLTGPDTFTVDLSFMKSNRIKERVDIQFRAEAFNLLNHANFALPTVFDTESASAGRITRTTTSSRQLQFGLKLIF